MEKTNPEKPHQEKLGDVPADVVSPEGHIIIRGHKSLYPEEYRESNEERPNIARDLSPEERDQITSGFDMPNVARDLSPEERAQITSGFDMPGEQHSAPPATPEAPSAEVVRERLIEDVMELATDVYRKRMNKEPDQKILAGMRERYRLLDDEGLRRASESLLKEVSSLS